MKVNLKSARVNAGYTQKEVCKILGIAEKTLINWEQYKTIPNARQCEELSELYNMPLNSIIFYKN